MEVKFKRQALLEKSSLVIGLTETASPNEILRNILLRSSKRRKELFIAATDIESTIVSFFEPGEGGEADFDLLVPGRKFVEILRRMEQDEVLINVHKNNWMEIKTSSALFRLPCLSGKDFPKIPSLSSDKTGFSIPVPFISYILPSILNFASEDTMRRNINGVLFEMLEGGKVRLVSTDTHRLAYYQNEVDSTGAFDKAVISKRALAEIAKVLKASEKDSEDKAGFHLQDGKVFFTLGETTVISSLIDSDFPEYSRVIPDISSQEPAVCDKNRILGAVRRVSIFSEKIGLHLTSSSLSFSSGETDEGEATESVSVTYSGEEKKASFNPRFIADSLNLLDGDEIEIRPGDGSSPAVITLSGSDDFVCILMPVV